jgi:hypothetical protein
MSDKEKADKWDKLFAGLRVIMPCPDCTGDIVRFLTDDEKDEVAEHGISFGSWDSLTLKSGARVVEK